MKYLQYCEADYFYSPMIQSCSHIICDLIPSILSVLVVLADLRSSVVISADKAARDVTYQVQVKYFDA